MKKVTVLAHDPGSKNYGVAVVQGSKQGDTLRIRVLASGKQKSLVNQLKRGSLLRKQLDAYVNEVLAVKKKYKPHYFVAERYMTRGIKGLSVECINMMLSAAVREIEIPYTLLAAVTWKRFVEKCGVDLKKAYKWCKAEPHQLDSALMGVYAVMQILKLPRQKIPMKKLILAIEKVSTVKLTNRVLRRKNVSSARR